MANINLTDQIKHPETNAKLFQAISQQDIPAVTSLIDKGFDIYAKDAAGRTFLTVVCYTDNMKLFRLLINSTNNTDDFAKMVNIPDNTGASPLTYATYPANMEMVKLLVEELRADVNHQDLQGRTPIFYAVNDKYLEIAKYLYKHGANLSIKDKEGRTPLLYIMKYGSLPLIKFLVASNKEALDWQDNYGNDALMKAISYGFAPVAKYLISQGITLRNKNNNGETAVSLAKLLVDKESQKDILHIIEQNGGTNE